MDIQTGRTTRAGKKTESRSDSTNLRESTTTLSSSSRIICLFDDSSGVAELVRPASLMAVGSGEAIELQPCNFTAPPLELVEHWKAVRETLKHALVLVDTPSSKLIGELSSVLPKVQSDQQFIESRDLTKLVSSSLQAAIESLSQSNQSQPEAFYRFIFERMLECEAPTEVYVVKPNLRDNSLREVSDSHDAAFSYLKQLLVVAGVSADCIKAISTKEEFDQVRSLEGAGVRWVIFDRHFETFHYRDIANAPGTYFLQLPNEDLARSIINHPVSNKLGSTTECQSYFLTVLNELIEAHESAKRKVESARLAEANRLAEREENKKRCEAVEKARKLRENLAAKLLPLEGPRDYQREFWLDCIPRVAQSNNEVRVAVDLVTNQAFSLDSRYLGGALVMESELRQLVTKFGNSALSNSDLESELNGAVRKVVERVHAASPDYLVWDDCWIGSQNTLASICVFWMGQLKSYFPEATQQFYSSVAKTCAKAVLEVIKDTERRARSHVSEWNLEGVVNIVAAAGEFESAFHYLLQAVKIRGYGAAWSSSEYDKLTIQYLASGLKIAAVDSMIDSQVDQRMPKVLSDFRLRLLNGGRQHGTDFKQLIRPYLGLEKLTDWLKSHTRFTDTQIESELTKYRHGILEVLDLYIMEIEPRKFWKNALSASQLRIELIDQFAVEGEPTRAQELNRMYGFELEIIQEELISVDKKLDCLKDPKRESNYISDTPEAWSLKRTRLLDEIERIQALLDSDAKESRQAN